MLNLEVAVKIICFTHFIFQVIQRLNLFPKFLQITRDRAPRTQWTGLSISPLLIATEVERVIILTPLNKINELKKDFIISTEHED